MLTRRLSFFHPAEPREVLLDDAGRVASPGFVHTATCGGRVPEQHPSNDDATQPAANRVQRAEGGNHERGATRRGSPRQRATAHRQGHRRSARQCRRRREVRFKFSFFLVYFIYFSSTQSS